MSILKIKFLNYSHKKKHEYSTKCIEKILSHRAHFDARVFNISNEIESVNNLYWRCGMDCVRNSISRASSCFINHKELQNKNSREKKKMLLEKGFDFFKN